VEAMEVVTVVVEVESGGYGVFCGGCEVFCGG
jgi:hypothetical protein